MTTGITNSPYLPVAPIYDEITTPQNRLTDAWKNHFDAIAETISYVVVHDRFNDTKQETPLTVVISMEEPRRNQLDNAINGAIIYNLTTKRFNFRENGAWVTFTPIPA